MYFFFFDSRRTILSRFYNISAIFYDTLQILFIFCTDCSGWDIHYAGLGLDALQLENI